MRIEISAGGVCGVSILDFRSEMGSFLSAADDVIASFKTIKSSTYNLSGGVGDLQDALDEIDERLRQEEKAKQDAESIRASTDDFVQLAVRVDKQVAQAVNKNKEEDYRVMPWLAASVTPLADRAWYEEAWNWLCGVGEDIAEGAEKAWDWVSDTAQKAWDGLVEFYDKHWYEIINWGVTILCAVGSIVAIALIPVTGGLSILVVAGVSAISGAIVAATRSITTQQRDKGEVDWGEVGKEAAIAAVVGAITGAIGAGVGGAITSQLSSTGLGSALLGSSSTAIRMVTGAVIGSVSEVVSGVMTRGAAEATQSYLETGSVDFGDVWDAATDPQQMLLDAAIGGASGGFSAMKQPETAPADTNIPANQKTEPPGNSGTLSSDLENPDLFNENQQGVYTYGESSTGGKTASGSLKIAEDPARNAKAQTAAGGDARRGSNHQWGADDGGHLIGARFGGETGDTNLTAQNRNLNRGGYKSMEDEWARHLADGDKVFVHIETDSAQRPNAYMGYAIYESPNGTRTFDTFHYVNESRTEIAKWELDLEAID